MRALKYAAACLVTGVIGVAMGRGDAAMSWFAAAVVIVAVGGRP